MRTLIRHQLAILCTAAAVFLIGLGAPRLWDEDEPEYARCTQEMMHRGDLIVPTFNEHLWTDKPVLLYWMMMASFSIFGQTEFAARFPCALLAIGTALLTYHLARRLFREQVGLWAGLIVATTASFAVVSRAAAPDAPLIFCTTLSLVAYVYGVRKEIWSGMGGDRATQLAAGGQNPPSPLERFRAVLPRSWWSYVGMYAPMGVAVLAKGPVGVLLPVAALGIWVLIVGAAKKSVAIAEPASAAGVPSTTGAASDAAPPTVTIGDVVGAWFARAGGALKTIAVDFPAATWAMRPVTLALIVLAIALPWYIAVGVQTHGAWTNAFFLHHNVDRFLHPMERHDGSFLYYPVALLIGFFPWALTLVLSLITVVGRIRRREAGSRPCVFAIAWSLTWMVVFSLSASKLSHYIAPTYPLMAALAGLWIADWIATPERVVGVRWFRWGWLGLVGMGVGVAVVVPIVISHFAPQAPRSPWIGLILVAGGAAGWMFQRRGQSAYAATSMVAMAVALFVGLFAVAAAPISNEQTSIRLINAVNQFADASTPIATYRIRLPAFVYYAGRPGPIMGVRPMLTGDEHNLLVQAKSTATGPIDPYQPDDTQLWLDSLDDALLITDVQGLEQLRPILPADAVVLAREKRFLKSGELLLVGRRTKFGAAQLASRAAANRK